MKTCSLRINLRRIDSQKIIQAQNENEDYNYPSKQNSNKISFFSIYATDLNFIQQRRVHACFNQKKHEKKFSSATRFPLNNRKLLGLNLKYDYNTIQIF
jgi:hypothetical protein